MKKYLLILLLFISLAQAAPDDNTEEWLIDGIQPNHIISLEDGTLLAYDVHDGIIYRIDASTGNYTQNDIFSGEGYNLSTYQEDFDAMNTLYASNMVLTADQSKVIINCRQNTFAFNTETLEEEWCILSCNLETYYPYSDNAYISRLLIDEDDNIYYILDYKIVKIDTSSISSTPSEWSTFNGYQYFTTDELGIFTYPILIPEEDKLIVLVESDSYPPSEVEENTQSQIVTIDTSDMSTISTIPVYMEMTEDFVPSEVGMPDLTQEIWDRDIWIEMYTNNMYTPTMQLVEINDSFYISGVYDAVYGYSDNGTYNYLPYNKVVATKINSSGILTPILYTEDLSDGTSDGYAYNRGEITVNSSNAMIIPLNGHASFGSGDSYTSQPSILIYVNDELKHEVDIASYFASEFSVTDTSFLLVGAPLIDTNDYGYVYTIDINDEDMELDTNGVLSGLLCFDTRTGEVIWFASTIEPNSMFTITGSESPETFQNSIPSGSHSFIMEDGAIIMCTTEGIYKFDISGNPLLDVSEANSGEYPVTPILYQYSSSPTTNIVEEVIRTVTGSGGSSHAIKTATVTDTEVTDSIQAVTYDYSWIVYFILGFFIYLAYNKFKPQKPKRKYQKR
jgi:hypothetical protein